MSLNNFTSQNLINTFEKIKLSELCTFIISMIIPILTAYIAYNQYKFNKKFNEHSANINEEKLKLDLYDRRYKIYNTYLNLLINVFNNKIIPEEDLRKVKTLEGESTFLFKEDTSSFIKAVSRSVVIMNKFNNLFDTREDIEDNISTLNSKISGLKYDLRLIEKKIESTSIQINLIQSTINNTAIDSSKLSYIKNELNHIEYHWLYVNTQTNLIDSELCISQIGLNNSEYYNLDNHFDTLNESDKLNYIIYILNKLKEEHQFILSVKSTTFNKLQLMNKELNNLEKVLIDHDTKNNIEYKKLPKYISRFMNNHSDFLSGNIDNDKLNAAKNMSLEELHLIYYDFVAIIESDLYDNYNSQFELYLNFKNIV